MALVGARPTVMDSPSTRRKTSVHFEPSRITRYAVIEYRCREVRSTPPDLKRAVFLRTLCATHFPDKAPRVARGPTCRKALLLQLIPRSGPCSSQIAQNHQCGQGLGRISSACGANCVNRRGISNRPL